jgi:hypothetical protein
MEPYIEDVIPKDGVKEGKGKDKLTFVVVEGTPLFFRVREGPYFPTLHLLHQCAWRCCWPAPAARATCPPPPTAARPSQYPTAPPPTPASQTP